MGPAPPTPVRVKEEPPSPPRVHVKHELASPLRQVKDEPASPSRNRGLHICGRVKQEPSSSPPHSRYARIDGPSSPPKRHRRQIKEEVSPAIAKTRGRILHYLGGGGYGGASGSRAVVSEAERAARQQVRYDRRNAGRPSAFAKTDVAPEWVRNDPDLTAAWALDRSVTTAETAAGLTASSPRSARSGRLATALPTPAGARPPPRRR